MHGTVLVVDDSQLPRRALASELQEAGFRVLQASDGEEGWAQFCATTPDVVITDLEMPRADGLDLLTRIRAHSDIPVFMFTAYGTVETATTALKSGADDFVSSVDRGIESLVRLVESAFADTASHPENPQLRQHFVGESRIMRRTRERLTGLAALRTPVLVSGEPGTGRHTAIHLIREMGGADGKLIQFDANSATDRTEPSFSGVAAVFLEGVEAFSPEAQHYWASFIAAAEKDAFRRAPRILASTSEPLSVLNQDEHFEKGLGRVLLRFALELPPLRTVRDDIPAIATHMVDRIGVAVGRRIRLSPAAIRLVTSHPWRGNAAQLAQVLERAVAYTRGRQIRRDVIAEIIDELEVSLDRIRQRHSIRERDELIRVLRDTGGNISHTAEQLGRSRSAIYRLIDKHGIALRRES